MPSSYNDNQEEFYNNYSQERERVERPCKPWEPEKPCKPWEPEKPCKTWEDHDKEKLFAKVFCICDCDDLQDLINCFLKNEVDQKHHCIKPEFMVSLGCKCPCGQETVVLFFRKVDKVCPMKDWH